MVYQQISKNIIEPIKTSNILYVNSIEEFEKLEIKPNQTIVAFDNFMQCFYLKECDKFGQVSDPMIYFYNGVNKKAQEIEREEFIKKCKEAELNELKTTIACMFFLENKTPLEVWEWSLKNTTKDWQWDYVRSLKCRLKKKLFKKL